MPIIFIRYILPFILILVAEIYLSLRKNKFLGLILPIISIILTIILMCNALNTIGMWFAFLIMLAPNIILFAVYIIIKKMQKSKQDEYIKFAFKDKFKK